MKKLFLVVIIVLFVPLMVNADSGLEFVGNGWKYKGCYLDVIDDDNDINKALNSSLYKRAKELENKYSNLKYWNEYISWLKSTWCVGDDKKVEDMYNKYLELYQPQDYIDPINPISPENNEEHKAVIPENKTSDNSSSSNSSQNNHQDNNAVKEKTENTNEESVATDNLKEEDDIKKTNINVTEDIKIAKDKQKNNYQNLIFSSLIIFITGGLGYIKYRKELKNKTKRN